MTTAASIATVAVVVAAITVAIAVVARQATKRAARQTIIIQLDLNAITV